MQEKNLQTQLEEEMHKAMKQHNEVLLSTLRMLRSAISNRKIEKRGKVAKAASPAEALLARRSLGEGGAKEETIVDLSNEEVLEVIKSEAKKRRDAVSEFSKAGRKDLAEKEEVELKILEQYLPAELSDEEIEKLLQPIVVGASMKDFGRVMGAGMKAAGGRASGDRVGMAVKRMIEKS